MAITKLLRLKECGHGNQSQHLKNNIKYILNPEKTQGGLNVGGNAGVTWEWAYDSMIENKQYWHKADGTQGFHYVISFPPELNVSMEQAHEVAQAFCEELLGEDYLYVYAIHDDKPHLHIHVTFDSVSRIDGMKFHSPRGDWEKRIQPITDKVCRKYGLPVLEFGLETSGTDYKSWMDNNEARTGMHSLNQVSWNDVIRDDIDDAVAKSTTYEEFIQALEEQHYQIRDGKYLSLKPYGKQKAVRTRSLGEGYGKEAIIERISLETVKTSTYKVYGDSQAIRFLFIKKRYGNPSFHMSSFQQQFYQRWRNTCFIRRPGYKDAWKHKKDVMQLQQISDQLKYLLDNEISSPKEAEERKADLEKERKATGSVLNAAKASFYKDTVCILMRKRKKLLEKEYNGEDVREMLQAVEKEIEEIMPISAAEERFLERREHYDEYRLQMRNLKREISLVNAIMEETKELFPDRDPEREIEIIRQDIPDRPENISEKYDEKSISR